MERMLRAAKRQVLRERARRRAAETALRTSRRHYRHLLAESRLMQTRLRHLSHQVLLAQEEERKHISRELHDEISQILTGINVRLATLKIEAAAHNVNLRRKIACTQQLVEKSVVAVHRFARELRPAMLDDLGLVPALLAFMKDVAKRTGLQIRFRAAAAATLAQLDSLRSTVLYRIAQEALTNVAKHAHASHVKVSVQTMPDGVCMSVSDDGRAFDVDRVLMARTRTHLGLLGMRERAEMVAGTLAIVSVAGRGTRVRVRVPLRNRAGRASGTGLPACRPTATRQTAERLSR